MAFIELESAEVGCGHFLINADDIVEVTDGKEERHVYTQREKDHAEYRVSTFYDEIYNRLMTEGQNTAYKYGVEGGLDKAAWRFREKADCIAREDMENYITKRLSGYLTAEERAEIERLAEFVAELPKVDILDIMSGKGQE